jgi:hypothetical protein
VPASEKGNHIRIFHSVLEAQNQVHVGTLADDADYLVDKALATGAIDSNGDLVFHIRGTREEIVGRMMASAGAWNMPMSRAEAERRTDAAIAASTRPQRVGWFLICALWVVAVTMMVASLWR